MALYSVSNSTNFAAQVNTATTDISLISLIPSTAAPSPTIQLRRGHVYDIMIGTVGTPADNSVYWSMQRCTAGSTPAYAGYASSLATLALDPSDTSPATGVIVNSSIETSYVFTATNTPWYVGVNQRASYRWVAAPGSEIVWPATASAGVVLRVKSPGYVGGASGTVFWSE